MYTFPGYDETLYSAEAALQEWIDTNELVLDESESELLYQFTHYAESAEYNIRAIQEGADYLGLDLKALGYPLPVKVD